MKQNFLQLLAIQVGSAICLPVIMVGQMLALNYGTMSALIVIMLGNLFLLLLALPISVLASRVKKPALEIAGEYFGRKGEILFSIILIMYGQSSNVLFEQS
jgi:cytosine permease